MNPNRFARMKILPRKERQAKPANVVDDVLRGIGIEAYVRALQIFEEPRRSHLHELARNDRPVPPSDERYVLAVSSAFGAGALFSSN